MRQYNLFLSWWLKIALMSVGILACLYAGVFSKLWREDLSKLSFVIIYMFVFFTGLSGISIYRYCRDQDTQKAKSVINRSLFWATRFQSLGMIGTVVGFIIVLGGNMEDLDAQNIEEFKEFVKNMAYGLSTALYTTLAGLVCSFLLRIQLFPLQSRIESNET